MDQLTKNILWRFKYYFVVAAIVIAAAICAIFVRQMNERALRMEAAHKVEQEKLKAEQARLQLEESNRLATIQEVERQKQAKEKLAAELKESNRVVRIKAKEAREWLEESNRLATIQEVERQKQAKEKLAADLKAYKARYLGNPNTRYSMAILVANETGQPNAPLGHAFGTLLTTNGLTTTASLLTPEFIADGLFDKTIGGSKESFDKLELTNLVQAVLLAHQSVQYSTNSALNGLITATMAVDVNTFSIGAFRLLFADNIRSVGAGFNLLEARTMAEERVLKQFKDGHLGSVQKAVLAERK